MCKDYPLGKWSISKLHWRAISWDIWIEVDLTGGIVHLWLFDKMLNRCFFWIFFEGLWTHTMFKLANYIFQVKMWSPNRSAFHAVRGGLVRKNDSMIKACNVTVSRTRDVLWYVSKGPRQDVCTLCLTFAACDVCHPGCRQDTDQCVSGECTMMSQTGKGWKGLGTFWNWLDPHWLSRNAGIINRQSEGNERRWLFTHGVRSHLVRWQRQWHQQQQ